MKRQIKVEYEDFALYDSQKHLCCKCNVEVNVWIVKKINGKHCVICWPNCREKV